MHPDVISKSKRADFIIEQLFVRLKELYVQSERGTDLRIVRSMIRESPSLKVFFDFCKNTSYTESTPSWRIIVDYIAGMTDIFAYRTFSELFLPVAVV
jgi:dGTP triphosphohydrolase